MLHNFLLNSSLALTLPLVLPESISFEEVINPNDSSVFSYAQVRINKIFQEP